LFIGWTDYSLEAKSLPIEAQVFNAWFLALNPPKIALDGDQGLVAELEREFPGLAVLPPARQRQRLRRSIQKWKRDRGLLASELTDRRPLILS
jgi:hypothetical protein